VSVVPALTGGLFGSGLALVAVGEFGVAEAPALVRVEEPLRARTRRRVSLTAPPIGPCSS